MKDQDARNHSLWATLRVDFQLHRNKPGNKEVAHHRNSWTLFCQNLPCGSIYGAWSFGIDPHRYLMPKFRKKEAIMITNKPAHGHKFNSDCLLDFLFICFVVSQTLFICCVVSQTLWFVLCVYCCTPFFCYLWCVPKCRLFFLFPHPLNHARNLVATARSVRGGGAHFQFGTEIQLPT